jgi:4-oxalocrotonate tautomerase
MPWITITLSKGRTPKQKAALAAEITRSMCEHLECQPRSIGIVFHDVEDQNWSIGGKLLDESAATPQR